MKTRAIVTLAASFGGMALALGGCVQPAYVGPAYHCRAVMRTQYGPEREFCPLPQPQPLRTACYCPPPPAPPGYPPAPAIPGRAVR